MSDGSAHLNRRAKEVADGMIRDADRLRIAMSRGTLGETLIDAGARVPGSIEAGLRIAQAAMGGLGTVTLSMDGASDRWPFTVEVRSSQPVLACLGSQYAGWNLSTDGYFAMGSGPARALARIEPLYETLEIRETGTSAVLILETAEPPPPSVVEKVAKATGVPASGLSILYAPTQSLAGTVQIVARVLEVALHKAHDLGFPLDAILEGVAAAPVPAPHPDFLTAMGRTNDAIIYGGIAQLFVRGSAHDAARLAEQLPSGGSRDHGKPFRDIFKAFGGDFYAIDPLLFSPAEVIVTALDNGATYRAGRREPAMLELSLG